MSYEAWHKGYQEVRNVIHNEMGVTKEEILEIFKQVAKDEIQKIVSEKSTFIRESIREVIRQEMINSVSEHKYPKVNGHMWIYGSRGGENSFKDYVAGVMKEEIINRLEQQFDVSLNIDLKRK
jgi:hypothetical protein